VRYELHVVCKIGSIRHKSRLCCWGDFAADGRAIDDLVDAASEVLFPQCDEVYLVVQQDGRRVYSLTLYRHVKRVNNWPMKLVWSN